MIERVNEWRVFRSRVLYAAYSPEHVWFRLFGRGLAAKRLDAWLSLSERYAGQHGLAPVRWVRVGGWRVRWIGKS